MSRILFLIVGLISYNSVCFAQDNGYIKFPGAKIWVVEINDSLYSSDQIVSLTPGKYVLKARPQISYNWPSIYVEDEFTISEHDTVTYFLEKNISLNENIVSQQQLPTTPNTNNIIVQNIREKSYLKDGILMGAVAANWLSFYIKRVADSYYKDYKKASSLSGLKKNKNKYQDFDLYSQITLGLSSALLTGYIYLTITE